MQQKAVFHATFYLGDRVRKQVLPRVEPTAAPGAPALKRLALPQGEMAQLLDGHQTIRYLAFIELHQGTVRGNHFHNAKQEFMYLIEGRAALWVEDPQSKARDRVPLEPGDLVFISPGIAHRVDVLEAGKAVEFSEEPFNGDDIHRYAITV